MSAFVIAPLVEEAVFRVAVARLAGRLQVRRGPVAVGSAVVFGLMHQRFGAWFAGYAFLGGLGLWAAHARAGYVGAVLLHACVNVVDLSVGWRRFLRHHHTRVRVG